MSDRKASQEPPQGAPTPVSQNILQGVPVGRDVIFNGDITQNITIDSNTQPPEPSPERSADELVQYVRSRLHDDIQRLHGTMPLWGVDHWVPLGNLFVDVNILEELSSSRKSELDDLWQDFTAGTQEHSSYRSLDRIGLGRERQRVSGFEVLARNTNLMVVGKPGSGKTTYLQRVVTDCNTGNLQATRIPVLIKLRDFVEDGQSLSYSLKQYLEQYWQLSTTEAQLVLSQGRSLVLLDRLDEVTGEDGKTIAKQIKQFARIYPQVQVVVTCRTQSQESRFERFDYVEVADFNEPQVRSFAEHWFITVMHDDAAGLAKSREFLEQLFHEGNRPIRELAITPILLSLTCAVFHQRGKFYSKRSKLYEKGLELLLEQWDKSREIERDAIYRDLSVERKLELLSHLAVKKFEQEQYVLFEQAEIERDIAEFLGVGQRESRAVLRAIESQHGLLIERSQRGWSFSHLTFQEYLVTKWFCSCKDWVKLVQSTTDYHWREVFLLITEIESNINQFLLNAQSELNLVPYQDDQLYKFVRWTNFKAEIVKSEVEAHQSSARVRAFYFERCLISVLMRQGLHSVMGYHELYLRNTMGLDSFLISLIFEVNCWINGREAFQNEDTVVEDSAARFLQRFETNACKNYHQDNLKQFLQTMRNELPEYTGSLKDYFTWWKENGTTWRDKLVQAIVFRNLFIVLGDQLSESQKSLFRSYHSLTWILLECLNHAEKTIDLETRKLFLENLMLLEE